MKKIIFLILLFVYSNASTNNIYKITYNNMTLGDIKNMKTIKDGYLIAVPSSYWMKLILGFDKFVLFQENKKPSLTGDVKYKKDKHLLLTVIYNLSKDRKSQVIKKGNNILAINCNGTKCNYIRSKINKNKKFKGHIYFDKNNNLEEICDYDSDICISKK